MLALQGQGNHDGDSGPMKLAMKILTIAIAFIFPEYPTEAQQRGIVIKPYVTPAGLGLLSRNLQGGHPRFYGAMSSRSNWHFTQWGAPEDLAPLVQAGTEWSSAAPWANIHVSQHGNSLVETVTQDGGNMPCLTPQGQPNEVDLLVEPNDEQETAPSAINPRYGVGRNFPNLAQLTSLQVNGILEVKAAGHGHGPSACRVNHAGAGYGITLVDDKVTPHQVFWYNLQIAGLCLHGVGVDNDFRACSRTLMRSDPWWYWTGNMPPNKQTSSDGAGRVMAVNFALGDVTSSFGLRLAVVGVPKTISIDFLPRLTKLIKSGKYGIDPKLEDWRLGQVTFGQALWGNTTISTAWHDFTIKWSQRTGDSPTFK